MAGQPRILRTCGGHGRLQGGAGVGHRLAEGDAEPALRHEEVGDRGRPVAGVHDADREGIGEGPALHQRIDHRIAARLEVGQRCHDGDELLDRAHALGATRRVRGQAAHGEPEGQRPAVRGHDVEAGRLGDHAQVGGDAVPQQGEGAEAAVLLAAHGREHDIALEVDARRPDGPHRRPHRRDAGLHVARPAGDQALAALDLERARDEGVSAPGVGVAGGHDVGVPVEQQGGPRAVAGEGGGHADGGRTRHLHAGEVAVALQSLDVDVPLVDGQALVAPAACEVLLHLDLGPRAAHRGEQEQLGEVGEQGVLVDPGDVVRGGVGHPRILSSREPRRQRVRNVGNAVSYPQEWAFSHGGSGVVRAS